MRLPPGDHGQTDRCPQRSSDRKHEPVGDRQSRNAKIARWFQPLSGGRGAYAGNRARSDSYARPLSGLRALRKRSLPAVKDASQQAANIVAYAEIPRTDI